MSSSRWRRSRAGSWTPTAIPVAGATVRPDLLPGGDFSLRLAEVATDQDGRFLVPDVPPDAITGWRSRAGATIKNRRFAFHEKVTVKPGETTDVGEIRFKTELTRSVRP